MSSNLVVAAIPADDDLVWKVSSEKKPHMTLLFLGESEKAQNLDQIMLFVEHAVTLCEHGPFYLDVDHRGTLGPDEADVLFFNKRSWNLKWIKQFRGQLLQNQAIKTAYDSVADDQYPEWTPHLTLGYPATPANEIPDDRTIYSVEFDRIAVWTGDFEGPDFRLEWPEREEYDDYAMAVHTMGGIAHRKPDLEVAVEHFGTKGMRWGQRKTETVTVGGKTKQVTPKKAAKLDAQWEKNQYTIPKAVERHNAMADHFNQRIGALNDKYKDHDFSKEWEKDPADWSPKHKEYMKEVDKLENEGFHQAVKQELPSPTGKKKTEIGVKDGMMSVVIKDVAAKHTAVEDGDEVFLFKVTFNANGLIAKTEPVEDSMAQTEELGAEFLEHFGTKGMKWGVRKEQLKSGAKAVGRGLGKASTALADVDFESKTEDGRARASIESMAITAFHRTDLPKIKAKPEYQEARKLKNRLRHPKDPATKQYRKETKEAYINRLEEAANKHTNASGTRQYTIRERGWELPAEGGALPASKNYWDVSSRAIKHALSAEADHNFTVEVIMDEDGFITDLQKVAARTTAEHGAVFAEGLMHSGVKGMKWGVRKEQFQTKIHERRKAVEASNREARPAKDIRTYDTIGTSKRQHSRIDTKGGEDHPPTEDAIKVAASRQKMKKSGPAALSNQELRDVAQRLQLEQQVHSLEAKHPQRKSLGRKFVDKFMGSDKAKEQVGGFVGAQVAKKLAKAGAVAAL